MNNEDRSPSQKAAETLWFVATSEDHNISRYDSPAYRAAENALIHILRAEYKLSHLKATRVRNLLAEYGPWDALQGTDGRHVASYVQFVNLPENRGRDFG